MSFSKAKLKRFNEVPVGDSPSCSSSDRKDQIKKFLKDLKDGTSCKDKEPKEHKEKTAPSTPCQSDTESVKSSKSSAAMRLFRTPSLPHRLRFRQNSDISTPKKELQKDVKKGKEALEAAQVEIKNKNETIQEYANQIDELRAEMAQLKESDVKHKAEFNFIISDKNEKISALTKALEKIQEENSKLQNDEKNLRQKTTQLENEIKLLLDSHDREIQFLTGANTEIEMLKEKLQQENGNIVLENQKTKIEIEALSQEIGLIKIALESYEDKDQAKALEIEKLSRENVTLMDQIDKLKKQIQDDILAYAQESQRMLKELDDMKVEKIKLLEDIEKRSDLITALKDELSEKDIDLDSYRDSIRDSFQEEVNNITRKYEQQIATLKEINEMKLKENDSLHILEVAKLNRDYQDKISSLEKDRQNDLERANVQFDEKLKISEVQYEQKINELEQAIQESVERERIHWKCEIGKCQKIAEAEIIQGEFEKQDLKSLLQNAHDMLRERDNKIKKFEEQLTNGIDYYIQLSEQLEVQVNEIKQECSRIMTEKYNYQLTLNNTRSTVNILMERLKKSDSDVELLKIELEATQNSKKEIEQKNNEVEDELKHLHTELDEYKNALTALRNSSQALEREMKEKETIFEKLMTSEEETLETVNKIGKLFNERIEENIDKYFEMYVELKKKYESRETYIKDMKSLLDEFATNIELARIELDTKDKEMFKLQNENKEIKLEIMTLKYRCEQFETLQKEKQFNNNNTINNNYNNNNDNYNNNDIKSNDNEVSSTDKENKQNELNKIEDKDKDIDMNEQNNDVNNDDDYSNELINNKLIESVLAELDLKLSCDKLLLNNDNINQFDQQQQQQINNIEKSKIFEENQKLKETLSEQIRRNNLLQEIIESESSVDTYALQKVIEEKEKALQNAENLAKEVSEKYNELQMETQNINLKNFENLKESNANLKNKISQFQNIIKEQEAKIKELQQDKNVITTSNNTVTVTITPRKGTTTNGNIIGTPRTPRTPRTPKTPKFFPGKENLSPAIESLKSPKNILKPRN